MKRIVLAVIAAAAVLMMAVAANVAAAQDQEAPSPIITGVDARGSIVDVSVLGVTESVASSDVSVLEEGAEAEVVAVGTARSSDVPTEVIYVLDIDNRIMVDGVLRNVAADIAAAVDALPSEVEVGLIAAGRQASLETRLTSDRDKFRADLQALTADQGAAIYDAVALAGDALSDRPDTVGSVVLVTAGADTASAGTIADATSALVQKGAQLVWVTAEVGESELATVVERTAGRTVATVEEATNLAADRLLVSFDGAAESGDRADVALSIAGFEDLRFSYPAGEWTTSTLQFAPTDGGEANDLGFFGQPAVLYISIVLAFAAISTALWSLGSMFAGGQTSLDKVLARYSDNDETLDEDEVQEMLVQTALIRRAIDMTETFAERRGFLARVEDLLERANVPVRAGEALFFLSAIVVFVFGLVFVVSGSVFFALIFGLISAMIGYSSIGFMAKRRLKQFESQLPDALQLLAGTLRAGYSMPQGLDAVSTEIADPMGQELRRAITETQLGREIEDSLAGIAERLDSADFAWAVMAIGIQREVGGNLAELLLTVAETMIQRERLHREVNALTAEGRVSAGILSLMPPALGLVMWVMNPAYIEILFSRRIGLAMLAAAVVSGLVGLAWMKKVITIDV